MQIFINVTDGVVDRVVVEDVSAAGKRVLVNVGAPDADGKIVFSNPPQHVTDTVTWATVRLVAAKKSELEATLKEFGGVSDEKLQAVLDAIEAEKSRK